MKDTQKIEPNRLWNKMSTGGKIQSSIAILLGGIGQGLSKSNHNVVLDMMDKQIDQDIEAQKSDINQKNNLFRDNLEKYKNIEQAEAATRLQAYSQLQGQIQNAGNRLGSQEALLKTKLAIQELQATKVLPLAQQLAASQTQQQVYGDAQKGGGIPVEKENIPYLNGVIKDYTKNRVEVDGRAYQAPEGAAQNLRDQETAYKKIKFDTDILEKLRQKGYSALNTNDISEAKGALSRLGFAVNEFNGYKRFTEVDKDEILKQFNNPASVKSWFQGNAATNDTIKALRNALEASRQNNLPNYKPLSNIRETPGFK